MRTVSVSVSFRLARIKIVVETRHDNPPWYWFRLLPPCTRFPYNFYQNVRDFLAPCSFSKPSRIHSTANHFSSSKSSLFSLDCECTHRPLLLLLVIFGEKSSAMKKKKSGIQDTPTTPSKKRGPLLIVPRHHTVRWLTKRSVLRNLS